MPITETEMLLRMAASILLGGAIGFERELRGQPAGLRTHILVSLGSATFMLVSAQFAFFQHYTNDGIVRVDMGRIASNVVVGIGFLGGGAIVHSGLRVKGLTTAADLWLVSAIGLASGAGMFVLAGLVTLATLFALVILRHLETQTKRAVELRVRLDLEGEVPSRTALADLIRPFGATLEQVDYSRDLAANRSKMIIALKLTSDSLEETLVKRLESLPGVRQVGVRRQDH